MIKFNGTRKIGKQSFLIFANENGYEVNVPVDDQQLAMFLLYFDRLRPAYHVEESNWHE